VSITLKVTALLGLPLSEFYAYVCRHIVSRVPQTRDRTIAKSLPA